MSMHATLSVLVPVSSVTVPWEACRTPLDGSGCLIHDRMLSVSCSAFVVQVRENVRGASLEGKALKTEQGLKVRPAVASSCERMCGVPLLFFIHSWVTGLWCAVVLV